MRFQPGAHLHAQPLAAYERLLNVMLDERGGGEEQLSGRVCFEFLLGRLFMAPGEVLRPEDMAAHVCAGQLDGDVMVNTAVWLF